MRNGKEGPIEGYPTPDDLWQRVYGVADPAARWRDRFAAIPFEDKGGQWDARYYRRTDVVVDAGWIGLCLQRLVGGGIAGWR